MKPRHAVIATVIVFLASSVLPRSTRAQQQEGSKPSPKSAVTAFRLKGAVAETETRRAFSIGDASSGSQRELMAQLLLELAEPMPRGLDPDRPQLRRGPFSRTELLRREGVVPTMPVPELSK